ncbi:MAG: TIGR02302 family protein [Ahrensia sp.]|nr:TIGR02302 family protein [Ahrensia sp.]
MANKTASNDTSKKLRSARLSSRFAVFIERAAPLVLPFALVIAAFFTVSWLGIFRIISDENRLALGAIFVLTALWSLLPLRRLQFSSPDQIDRRLERENGLLHQPITAQADRLAVGDDAFAQALWQHHQAKLATQVQELRGARAQTDIALRDPWALRTLAPLALVAAFAYSFSSNGGAIDDVMRSHNSAPTIPARIDAWITPPSYTGVAPIFMTSPINADRATFTAPEGSKIVVRIAGGSGKEQVSFPDSTVPVDQMVDEAGKQTAARQFEIIAADSGTLAISGGNQVGESNISNWLIDITPDNAPTVEFDAVKGIERATNGAMTLRYVASDDFRLAGGQAIISFSDEKAPNARPLYDAPEIKLTMPRRNADGQAKTTIDLTEHPFAGAAVSLVLEVKDDLDQIGRSKPLATTLPGRPFSNKLARALIEQRRILALDANQKFNVYDMLDLFMLYPEETINNSVHFLGLSTAQARLRYARNDDELRGVVDYLWEVARNIEDGGLSDAERRLKDAQQALRDALERGASDEEIEQLMAELRSAMQEFMREFAEQNQNNPNAQQQQNQQNAQQLDQQSLDEMLDQLEEMAKSGAREQAMEMLSQLQDMMNNLQMAQPQQGQGQQGQNQAQQQMNELGEILRQQQELMNDTLRRSQRSQDGGQEGQEGQQGQDGQQGEGQQGQQGQGQQGQGQQGQSPEGQGQQGQDGQQGQGQGQQGQGGLEGLAPGQQALQDRLQQFMQALEGMGINPGDEFGQAGEAMGDAGEALGQGSGEQALNDQGNAMDALRRGADSMMQQLQQQAQQQGQGQNQGQGQQGQNQPGGTQNRGDRDPLGRPQRTEGPDFGDSVDVPDEIDVLRAREILEAIRKRLGSGALEALEKDYLERLLDLN